MTMLSSSADAQNLIANSAFTGDDMPPTHWQAISTSANDLTVIKQGDLAFLRMRFSQPGKGGIQQNIKLDPGTKALSIAAWLKGKGIKHGGADYQRGCFEFFFYDERGQRLGGFPKFMVPNSRHWQKFAQVREVPDAAVTLRVSCVNHGGQGEYDFANLQIIPLTQSQLLLSSENDLKLNASWISNNRYAIFDPEQTVALQLTVEGSRATDEQLLWQWLNHDHLIKQGQIPVPKGNSPFVHTLKLTPEHAGYFQVKARLQKSGVTLPKRGTAPAGCVTFGVLPAIEALKLKQMDDSRFGVQGTTFIDTGKFMQGDPYNAYYKALGVRWVHRNRRLNDLEPHPGAYKPRVDESELKHAWPYDWDHKLATLIDAHGVPQWLIDGPSQIKHKKKYSNTFDAQKYPPRDFQAYGDILQRIAREAVNLHQHRFTYMKHNYYQIHWEPDWYWLGSDEQLVQMYRSAYEQIHKVDPNAKLLGCNFGVLQTGNDWMARMFRLGLGQYMDGIVTHAYYTYKAAPEVGIRPQMQRLVQMVRQYMGPDAMIMHSEWGDHWDGDYVTQSITPQQLRDEMSHILRGHLIVLGEGAHSTWFFYASDLGKRGGGMAFNLETHPRVGPTIISPKPLTMGVATMTRLLEGTRNLGTVDFLGDHVLGYAFDRAGSTVLALWSTDGQPREIQLPANDAVSLYDSFGNRSTVIPDSHQIRVSLSDLPVYVVGALDTVLPQRTSTAYPRQSLDVAAKQWVVSRGMQQITLTTPHVPQRMPIGTWLLCELDAQTGKWVDPQRLVVTNPLAMTLVPDQQRGVQGYRLEIQNHSVQSQTVYLPQVDEKLQVVIDAKSSNAHFLTMSQLRLEDGHYTVNVWDQAGRHLPVQIPAIPTLNTFSHTPTIDGDWRDWQLEMFQRVSGDAALAFRKAPLTGPKDFSFDYALAGDDKALYGIFKVSDDVHLPPVNPNEVWRGDSIQIALGMGLRADGNWGSVRRISFVLPKDQDICQAREVIGPPPIPPVMGQKLGVRQVQCVAKRDDVNGMMVYEFAIPWSEIATPHQLASVKYIGFGALVNDADTLDQITGDARKTMVVAGGAGLFSLHPKLGLFPLNNQ
ncbi:MAG: hypothetical protein ACF8OB_13365 [Phycisphaeraceae bacterium JB051]